MSLGRGHGPIFSLIRGAPGSAWAVRVELPRALVDEFGRLAGQELPITHLQDPPLFANRYVSLAGDFLF